jgi:nickel-dependent lactate racemase
MHVVVEYGRERAEYEVAADRLIASRPPPAALPDLPAALRTALENPFGFPALRRALTPGDRVVVVVDEGLPHLVELLVPLLEHVVEAGVAPEEITLVCPRSASGQRWADDLPESLEEVRLEVADPSDRRRLSYVATTREGRRLYLNRTVVDADQAIVLSACRYDPVTGCTGAESLLYPALSDEATRKEVQALQVPDLPDAGPWPARDEAAETAWLLGIPFFVQVIEAGGDGLAHVVAGVAEASAEARRLLDAAWKQTVPRAADVVVASLAGDPSRHTFADLAAALDCAARAVRPGGRIVVLSRANFDPKSPESALLRAADDPREVLAALERQRTRDQLPALRWARAAGRARLTLLSGLAEDAAEDLFATPLEDARQVQRLLDGGGACLFLPDAHKARVAVADTP